MNSLSLNSNISSVGRVENYANFVGLLLGYHYVPPVTDLSNKLIRTYSLNIKAFLRPTLTGRAKNFNMIFVSYLHFILIPSSLAFGHAKDFHKEVLHFLPPSDSLTGPDRYK